MEYADGSTRRHHIFMVTIPFSGHCAPFVQLLYQLRDQKNVTVTVIGHKDRLAEMVKLQERGEFSDLEIKFEVVFGNSPPYPADPQFPFRAATASAHMEIEFQPIKERLIEGKNDPGAPTAMVVDMFLWWTKDIADEMGIPWYPYYSTSSWFGVCAILGPLLRERVMNSVPSVKKFDRVGISGIDFSYFCDLPQECIDFHEFYANVSHRTLRATGILCNSSFEMEGSAGSTKAIVELVERRKKSETVKPLEDTKVLPIGPVTQVPGFGKSFSSSENMNDSIKWLNTQAEGSVLYLAFGSMGNVISEVIPEIAMGLEESGVQFLWVLKSPPGQTINQVLPEGFLDRTQARGYIETGWAPQTQILLHPAIGGFLTHCGWNSTLESLCAGVPMVTWPLSADQPMNARYMTDVKKVGIPVSEGPPDDFMKLKKDDVCKAVKRLMVSDEGKEIKKNSLELRDLLIQTVSEGGSSYIALRGFINDLVTL